MISYCQLTGHEQNKVVQICTYPNCAQFKRWMCLLCYQLKIHDHQQQNLKHIEEIQKFMKNVLTNNYQIFKEKTSGIDLIYMKYLKEIELLICQQQSINIRNIEKAFIKFQDDPFSVNKKELDSLVNFQIDIIDGYNKIINNLKFVITQCNEQIDRLEQIIYSFKTQNTLQCIQEQTKTYNTQKSYQSVGQYSIKFQSFDARVSLNEKQLVFCNKRGQLQLNHTYSCRNLGTLQLKMKKKIDLVTFSKNSNLIILKQLGALKVFRIGSICKLKRSLHLNNVDSINSLILIDSNLILVQTNKQTIIIADIITHRQYLQLQLKYFSRIDFDHQRQEIIIHQDNVIYFYNIYGKRQFSYELKSEQFINQLQKIQNSDRVLIFANEKLILLKVDYQQQKLIVINQFSINLDTHFSLICNNSLIALVGSYVIYILDVNLIKIQLIPFYNLGSRVQIRGNQQQDARNFLILQGETALDLIRLSNLK